MTCPSWLLSSKSDVRPSRAAWPCRMKSSQYNHPPSMTMPHSTMCTPTTTVTPMPYARDRVWTTGVAIVLVM